MIMIMATIGGDDYRDDEDNGQSDDDDHDWDARQWQAIIMMYGDAQTMIIMPLSCAWLMTMLLSILMATMMMA